MSTAAFTEFPDVVTQMNRLKTEFIDKNVEVSDILDDEGHQYVDLVMEGGGVLGIALAGYTYAMEKAGIRFLGVAGTSAGAINSLLIAAAGRPNEVKSEKIIKALTRKNLYDFVDGDDDVQDFVEVLVKRKSLWKIVWKGWQVIDTLSGELGLNPGDDFRDWLAGLLDDFDITTTKQLQEKMALPADLYVRDGNKTPYDPQGGRESLVLIAADLTTESKIEFPRMASLFWENPDEVNPAEFARASMSVPMFFQPFVVEDIPHGLEAATRWKDMTGYSGRLPIDVTLVDGGIMSNFPINIFHVESGVPKAPTFGAKLGVDRDKPRQINSFWKLFPAAFDAARHCLDYDFLLRNDDYKQLITNIKTGDHNWLNFAMKEKDQVDLFYRGVKHAVDFLTGFSWKEYKNTRARLAGQGQP